LPDLIDTMGILIAKIIVQKGATNFTSIETPFVTSFTRSIIDLHNELGNLQGGAADEYYHLTGSEYMEINEFLDDAILGSNGSITTPANIEGANITATGNGTFDTLYTTNTFTASGYSSEDVYFITLSTVNGKGDYYCDGTNDEVQLEAAITKADAVDGSTVHLMGGTYSIGTTFDVIADNLTIQGEGEGTVLKLADSANCHLMVVGNGATRCDRIMIRDLVIDGNKANNTGTIYGILFYKNVYDSSVMDCHIKNTKNKGLYFYYGYWCDSIHNWFENTGDMSIYSYYGQGNRMLFNHIDENDDNQGINISNTSYCLINNNTFDFTDEQAIIISGGSNKNIVMGNMIAGTDTDDGIEINNSDNNVIQGNTIIAASAYAIAVVNAGSSGNLIAGNTTASSGSGGISDGGTGTAFGVNYFETEALVSDNLKADSFEPTTAGGLTPSNASMVYNDNLPKVICTFDGTGTPSINNAYNISVQPTDDGTGLYTLTFSTGFANTDYTVIVGADNADGTGYVNGRVTNGGKTTGTVQIETFNTLGNRVDPKAVHVVIFGDRP